MFFSVSGSGGGIPSNMPLIDILTGLFPVIKGLLWFSHLIATTTTKKLWAGKGTSFSPERTSNLSSTRATEITRLASSSSWNANTGNENRSNVVLMLPSIVVNWKGNLNLTGRARYQLKTCLCFLLKLSPSNSGYRNHEDDIPFHNLKKYYSFAHNWLGPETISSLADKIPNIHYDWQ